MSKGIVGALLLAMATTGIAVGCGGGDNKKESGGGDTKPNAEAIGVPECDEYLKKAEACTSKIPPENKAGWETGIKTSRDTWKTSASSAEGKEAVRPTCKSALESLNGDPQCK